MSVSRYPGIDVSLSDNDDTSKLFTVQTRVPNEVFQDVNDVQDLFRGMFPQDKPAVLLDYIPITVTVSVGGVDYAEGCAATPDILQMPPALGELLSTLVEQAKTEVLIHYGG